MSELLFVFNSAMLGVGLAKDAFSVSLANGLNEPKMKSVRMMGIAGVFAGFQALMPMTGWVCVHTLVKYFQVFEPWIPWIALGLLCFIGGKMLKEGLSKNEEESVKQAVGAWTLLVQGIATSIDALSVGFTIESYQMGAALLASGIIAGVTFVICMFGLKLGKVFGVRLAGKAEILGGVILIGIGIEIWLKGILG